ncbi:MAG: DUF4159 domain-containing protein, partial [Armatimonadetes bacterium]|nr:DUF4159 domain-containing protein [Armatimonadota bacterium]
MKLIRYIFSLAIILGTLVAICMPADAGAYHYAGKRKKIYCGIVEIIDPQTGIVRNKTAIEQADNLFALLDALNDMKPAGWTLENPLALSQNKADPYYWRIPIASSRNLTRVNVLYFPGSGTIKLTADERENLRRFVDGGGVLWVDNANPSSPMHFDSAGLFFISKLDFKAGAVGFDGPVSRHHPLLTTPYWLTDVDIMSLGLGTGGSLSRSYCDMGTTALNQEPTSFDILFPIVDLSDQTGALAGKPSVVANAYGSGRVVATANAVGRGCLQPMPYNLPSLKFAFNIMAYGSTWTDLRKDPRHSGSSIDTIGSNPPVQKWWLPIAETGIRREASPLLYKNTVFYTSGDMLLALEQNADTKGGMWPAEPTGAVIVWDWKCEDGGVLSSPTIATVQHPDNNCQPIEAVMVQSSTGMVYVLNAFPIDANNVVMPGNVPFYQMETSSIGSANSSGKGRWPSPPIYVNGWIYALGGNGRLYAENPCLNAWAAGHGGATIQSGQWSCPDVNANPGWQTSPRCGPSYGSMRNANSGTVVGMVYWFTSPLKKENIELDETNDLVCSVPVSVSGERIRSLRFFDQTRTTARIDVTYKGLLSDVTVNIYQSDGVTPVPLARDPALNINENSVDTPGSIIVNTQVQIPRQYVAYVSYSLSYGSIGRKPTPGGGEIEPKSPKGTSSLVFPETIIEGTPVMGADNYLFLNGTRSMTPLSGGSILAYANDGGVGNVGMPTLGKLKWHYYLHSGVDNPNNTNVSIPGVIHTERGPMINPQPTSSPAVANGKVFVTVSSNNAPGDYSGPKSALLCLKSSADCVIRITESGGYDSNGRPIKRPKSLWRPNGAGNYNVRIWQPNLISESTYGIPAVDA